MTNTLKILIIDDNEVILEILENFLTLQKYDLVTAATGFEGINIFNNDVEKFDLVITDLIMPDISGVGVITMLKKTRPDIPIIAITGYGKHPELLATEAKADIVLEKPINLNILNQHIIDLMGKVNP